MRLLHFSMSAATSHHHFVQVRQKLISKLGPKLPLCPVLAIVVGVEANAGLHADRNVKRSRDKMIGWLAENWEKAEPYIDSIKNHQIRGNILEIQRNNERIDRAWGKMKMVNDALEQILGKKLNMKTLLRYAESITKVLDIRLDRSAKRNKKVLISWFCENWAKVGKIIENDLANGVTNVFEATMRDLPSSPADARKSEAEKIQSPIESFDSYEAIESPQEHEFKFVKIDASEISFDLDEPQTCEMVNFTEISNILDDDLHVSANNVFDYIEEYSLDFRKYF